MTRERQAYPRKAVWSARRIEPIISVPKGRPDLVGDGSQSPPSRCPSWVVPTPWCWGSTATRRRGYVVGNCLEVVPGVTTPLRGPGTLEAAANLTGERFTSHVTPVRI